MALIFLGMWDKKRQLENVDQYKPAMKGISDGIYQLYADGPANNPKKPARDIRDLKMLQEGKGTFEDWKRQAHPSYGMISFNRESCSPATSLFGSSIKHGNAIRMILFHAEIERGLNKDWFYAKGRIVEIEMSQSQFADAITSLNIGEGVPCTIRFTERDGYIRSCAFLSKINSLKES